jgi:hypothetical protein
MDPAWGAAAPEYEFDPELGWALRAGKFDLLWSGLREKPVRNTHWSHGQRATADEAPARDSPTRPRVLFFGDSYVQGYGLADWETLPWIVQKRHPEAQVLNFGTGSYGTYQCYLAMQKQVRGPVSAYYILNGFHELRNAADRSWLRIMKKPPEGWFYPYAAVSGGELQARKAEGNLVWPWSRRLRTVAMVQDYVHILQSYLRVPDPRKLTEILLVRMNETVRSRGGKFTVVLVDLAPEQRAGYRTFLESRKIGFVDCNRPELLQKGLRLADGHPNQRLNELLAEWIEPLEIVGGATTEISQGTPGHRAGGVW